MNNYTSKVMDTIDVVIRRFVADKDLVVLRDKRTKKALNVSYSKEGLMHTANASGRLLYFRNAHLVKNYDLETGKVVSVEFIGDIRMNPNVYVEKFVPQDYIRGYSLNGEFIRKNKITAQQLADPELVTIFNVRNQIAEYMWTDKAYRLLYHRP